MRTPLESRGRRTVTAGLSILTSLPRSLRALRTLRALPLLPALALAIGCEPPDTSSPTGGSGGGGPTTTSTGSGGTGGCLVDPAPAFVLTIRAAAGGPVPPDTTLRVTWSAGEEPEFHLDDPTTWATLETSNLVCDVDPTAPPPVDLPALTCALWTASPCEIRVTAKGFEPHEHTYSAMPSGECNPEPTAVEIEMEHLPTP